MLHERGLDFCKMTAETPSEHALEVQASVQERGDFLIFTKNEGWRGFKSSVDLKVERRSSRNIFFETASNAKLFEGENGYRSGWGVTVKSQSIWYAFSDAMVVAVIKLNELRDWLSEKVVHRQRKLLRYMTFTEVLQETHEQMNRTTGRLIPFQEIPETIWRHSYRISTSGPAEAITREEFLTAILNTPTSRASRSNDARPETQPNARASTWGGSGPNVVPARSGVATDFLEEPPCPAPQGVRKGFGIFGRGTASRGVPRHYASEGAAAHAS